MVDNTFFTLAENVCKFHRDNRIISPKMQMHQLSRALHGNAGARKIPTKIGEYRSTFHHRWDSFQHVFPLSRAEVSQKNFPLRTSFGLCKTNTEYIKRKSCHATENRHSFDILPLGEAKKTSQPNLTPNISTIVSPSRWWTDWR